MRRPKGSPDLIVRLQLVLAAWSNHQKNRPVTDAFLAEVVGKKPAEITQMLKRNPAFDELLSAEGYCNGHKPELEPLEETLDQLIQLLGVTDILHIKNSQPVAEVPQAAQVDVIETPACPPAEATDHSTMALAASDSAVWTKPVSVSEPEVTPVQEGSATEEAQAPPPCVPAVTEVATQLVTEPAPELTCSLPGPVVERMLIPNRPNPPVRQPHQVVVNEVPREALPRGPVRGSKQSVFPITRNQFFGGEEAGWKQSVRLSKQLTLTVLDVRVGRLTLKKISAAEYAGYWKRGHLEFQQKGTPKPTHLPSPEELEEFLTSLKMLA